MNIAYTIIGLLGALASVTAYGLLQYGVFKPTSTVFYTINAIASVLMGVATCAKFDKGDWGAAFINVTWFVISVIGIIRNYGKQHQGGNK